MAPWPSPALSARIVPPVEFDEGPADGETQAKPPELPGDPRVPLLESLEDGRQPLWWDPDSAVADPYLAASGFQARRADLDGASAGVNLTAFLRTFHNT